MIDYGFGRIAKPDPNDWPVKVLVKLVEAGIAEPVAWECPVLLNQEQTQHCVGFAWAGFLAAAQAKAPANPAITNADGHRIYYAAKAIDADGPAMLEEGSYVRSGAKALKAMGLIDAYGFGDFAATEDWTRRFGPVVMGSNWYESMRYPDAQGVVAVSGSVAGGHAYLRLADKQTPADNGFINSWNGWGANGRFYMSDADTYRLLSEGGEACMAVRFVVPPKHRPEKQSTNAGGRLPYSPHAHD